MAKTGFLNPLRSNPVSPHSSTYVPTTMMPISPPSTITSPYGNVTSPFGKQGLPLLAPIPLSPLTLKPSIKPPLSLDPPNPTTRTNFSPMSPPHDFPSAFQISGYRHHTAPVDPRPVSHSASASLEIAGSAENKPPRLKQRSPSQPHLPTYFVSDNYPQGGPPMIPLRISSIPTNNKTRKLSLPNHRSLSALKSTKQNFEEKENIASLSHSAGSITPRKVSPPLRTNKALPSPPMNREEELRTREKVKSSSPQHERSMSATAHTYESSRRRVSDVDKREGHVWTGTDVGHPGIAELPAISSTSAKRAKSHSRLHSAPVSSSLYYPYQGPDVQALSTAAAAPKSQPYPTTQAFPSANAFTTQDPDVQPTPPLKDSPRSKAAMAQSESLVSPLKPDAPCRARHFTSKDATSLHHQSRKDKTKIQEQGGWASGTHQQSNEGRPVQMSRTQKDKDRKKRSKAKVLMEHVDIIKDEFWEKRHWILSGKTA